MEQHGNQTTYNVENVLRQNILNSEYYDKTCQLLFTWDHVVDEIYEHVDHVEPWMSGNARGPSTAFCLLYRLFTLKLSVKQVKDLLDHRDSPYIRAVGFLYLRYVCDPKLIWGWIQRYVNDPEEFQPSGVHGKTVTMGDYVRDLFLEQNYFETILSRIPKKVNDEIVEELRKRGLPTTGKGNAGQGGADRRGGDEGVRRPASVKASLSVAMGQRAPNRAGTREEGRGKDPSMGRTTVGGGRERDSAAPRGSPAPTRRDVQEPARERGYSRERDPYDRDRNGRHGGRDRDRGVDRRDGRARDEHGRDDRGRGDRHRDDSGRDRQRDDRDREDRGRADRRSRSRSPRGDGRDRGRASADGRDARDVFRDRPGSADGRDARDVFRDRAAGGSADAASAKYGDASGKLFDDRSGRKDYMRAEEVYRIGGSRR